MGTREIKISMVCPIETDLGTQKNTGSIGLEFSSAGDTAFPEETHKCKAIISDKETGVSTVTTPFGPWEKDITGTEIGEAEIKIKWTRAYKISSDRFQLVEQPSMHVCWAAALTTMAAFRDGTGYTIEQVMKMADDGDANGHFSQMYKSDSMLYQGNIDRIVKRLGLEPLNMTDMSASSIFRALKKCGPIFSIVTGMSGGPSHALIIYGVDDTGGPNGHVDYIDVGMGQTNTDSISAFGKMFGNTQGLSCQMWYYPGMENIGTTSADGEGKASVRLSASYQNHFVSLRWNQDSCEEYKFPLEVSLVVNVIIGPCCEKPDVYITLKTNRFPEMTGTMSLTGNDSVVAPY